MEVLLRVDTEKDKEQELHNIISTLYNKSTPDGQQRITQTDGGKISIVVRDGEKETINVKEDLKQLNFNYYAKTKSGKDDPRWTLTCVPGYWKDIKDKPVFEGLNIWTSEGGGST